MSLSAELNHPERMALASEVHARPFVSIEAPTQVSHLALYGADKGPRDHHAILTNLCVRFGVAPPMETAVHFLHDFGLFQLKWERHSEFSTYMFISRETQAAQFSHQPIRHIPQDWLQQIQGLVLVALHLAVEAGAPAEPTNPLFKELFRPSPLVGSRVLAGGEVWTDFHVAADGFSYMLVRDTGLRETQTGRLVQRLCEIETYRMMALLALPLLRQFSHLLSDAEAELEGLTAEVSDESKGRSDKELMHDLSALAARLQALSVKGNFRYGAARAYYKLVEARITELREQRIEGVPTIGEFMERRVGPAMASCAYGAERLEKLGLKVAHVIDLLRTRVSIAQERQTHEVLESLSRNSQRQLRLQQAVEGLSVFAITYYATSLVGYLLKATKAFGMDASVDLLTAGLLPIIFGATWLGLHRFKKGHGE